MVIMAVDDERLALEGLASAIGKACDGADVYAFIKTKDALEFLNDHSCDVAFLDIEMREMNGMELADEIKKQNPYVNIIFTTGYSEYAKAALDLRASGYVMKPVTVDKIKNEMENLRYALAGSRKSGLRVQTFGNFEVFFDEKPLEFKYNKSKELFAYLIDRNGALCTNAEMISMLWEDISDVHAKESYFKNIRSDLFRKLNEIGCEDVLMKRRGQMAVVPALISCDLYDWIAGKKEALCTYRGEYMVQYSWSEFSYHRFK